MRSPLAVLVSLLLLATVAGAPAVAQPFYGYNTVEGICLAGSWSGIDANGLGTDCNDLTRYRPGVAALPNSGAAAGVTRPAVYRLGINADGVQAKMTGNGSWSNPWKQYDTAVKFAAAQGSKIVFVAIQGKGCTDTVNCADLSTCLSGHTCSTWEPNSYWVPSTAAQLARYQTWIKQIVQHYSGSGTLAQAVQAIEVWNEPNVEDPHEAGQDLDHQTWTVSFVRGAPEALLSPNVVTHTGTADVHTFTPSLYAQLTCAALAGRKTAVDAGSTRKDIYIGALAWHITSGTSPATGTSYYSLSSPTGSPGGPMGRWLSDAVVLLDAAHGCPAGSDWHGAQRYDALSMHAYSGPQAAAPLTGTQTGTNTCVTPNVLNDTRANVNGCKIAQAFDVQEQAVRANQASTGGLTDRIVWDEMGVRAGGTEPSGLPLDAATQAAAYRYLLAQCKARGLTDQDSGLSGVQARIAGCYLWPLRSLSGAPASDQTGSGLWTNALVANASATPWLDALENQRLNPTQYP